MIIHVTIRVPESANCHPRSVCFVEARDVSLLDAPSHTVAETNISGAELVGKPDVSTRLEIATPRPGAANLNVWVHLSLSGNRKIEKEDYLTVQAYPVPRGEANPRLTIDLRRVAP